MQFVNKTKYGYKPYILIAIFCILLGLTTIHGLDKSLYWDESVYGEISQHPLVNHLYPKFEKIFTRHPPLFIYSLSLIRKIPLQHETAFRLFSIILSMAGLSLIFLMRLESSDIKKAALIPLLLIFNTVFQQYAQSATMYSMLFFAHALLFYGISKKNTAAEIAGITIGLYSHYFMFITAALLFMFDILFSAKKLRTINWKKYIIITLLYSPWLFFAISGMLYHKSKFSQDNPSDNSLNFLYIFGIGGLFTLLSWVFLTIKDRFKNIKDSFESTSEYLKNFFMFFILFYIIILIYARPFIRYLYFIYPFFLMAYFDFITKDLNLSKLCTKITEKFSLPKTAVPLLKYTSFVIVLLLLFTPNIKLFGIFPYQNSIHDQRDNIHIQEWKELVDYMGKKPIGVENERSYFYYFAEKYPEFKDAQYPWDTIGIFEIKFKEKKKILMDYPASVKTVGIIDIPSNQWKIAILKSRGFVQVKKFKYMIVMQKE